MRTFVAVEISDDKVINAILKFQSQISINAKAVEPHNLHFTLQFLGEISEQQSIEVQKALQGVDFSSFRVNFTGIGVFPKMRFPRIIWIGTDVDGGNALISLAKKIEGVLAPLGFMSDKPFTPHITVFRIKNKIKDISKELQSYEFTNFGSQEITNFKFKQSILTPKGPVYYDLMEVKGK
jgi:2'-5' RNA ligase